MTIETMADCEVNESWRATPFDELAIPIRVALALDRDIDWRARNGFDARKLTAGDLHDMTDQELLHIIQIGRLAVRQIRDAIRRLR